MGEQFDRLKQRLADVHNVYRAASVLSWDQHTYMPPRGERARAEQLATLSRLGHDMFIAPETGELIAAAEEEVRDLPLESDEASLVRVARRDYEIDRKVPSWLIMEIQRHASLANSVWVEARENNDVARFAPCL